MQDLSLATLVHDINGKCTNLKSAAALLRGAAPKDELELLALMSKQARSLADAISAYEALRRGERPE
jgi:signal transduction histidine kinase